MDKADHQAQPHPPKRTWVRPELARIRAADAEAGANPISPEGAFATGS